MLIIRLSKPMLTSTTIVLIDELIGIRNIIPLVANTLPISLIQIHKYLKFENQHLMLISTLVNIPDCCCNMFCGLVIWFAGDHGSDETDQAQEFIQA